MLSVARRSAVKSRTQAANQIAGLIVTAPEHLKDRPAGHSTASLVETCTRWRPDRSPDHVTAAATTALRSLARRHQALTGEIAHLDAELGELCEHANPALLGACGVRPRRRRRAARHSRRQPPPHAQRSVLRRTVRRQPH